jgi:hypothetical protein
MLKQKHEIDLRKEFDELVFGANGHIPHNHICLVREARLNNEGKVIRCKCTSAITHEPDPESKCRHCLGEGFIWNERIARCYSSMVGADGGKGNRTKRMVPGEVRTDYKVFYFRYDEKLSYKDKIIELSLDLEGKLVIPYKRESIYKIETIQKYRSDNGRVEYIAVYCREESSIRENT